MIQRGSFSISTLILTSLREGPKTRTRIERELVLNYRRVERYCNNLLDAGLIEADISDRTFRLTPSGLQVLVLSEKLAELLPPVKDMIDKYQMTCGSCGNKVHQGNSMQPNWSNDNSQRSQLSILDSAPLFLIE